MEKKTSLEYLLFLVLTAAAVAVGALAARDARVCLGTTGPGFAVGRDALVLLPPPEGAGTLRAFDRVVAVDGQPVRTGQDILLRVAARPPGEPVHYGVRRGGNDLLVSVPCTERTERELLLQFLLPFATGAVFLAVGITVMVRSPRKGVAWSLFLTTLPVSVGFLTLFSWFYLCRLPVLGAAAYFLAPAMLLRFGLQVRMLEEDPGVERARRPVLAAPLALALAAAAACLWGFGRWTGPLLNAYTLYLYYVLLLVALGAAWDAWLLLGRRHPIVRYYSRVLRFGAVVGLLPFLGVMAADFLLGGAVPLLPFSATAIVYALVQAYLAHSYNLFDFNRYLRQGTVRLALLAIFLGCYGLVVLIANQFLLDGSPPSFLLLAGYSTLVVLLFGPLESWIRRVAMKTLFPSSLLYRETVEQSAGLIARLRDRRQIEDRLREIVNRVVQAVSFRILYKEGDRFRTASEPASRSPELMEDSPLVRSLQESRRCLTRRDVGVGIPENAAETLRELDRLGAELVVPVLFRDQVIGLFCLGPKTMEKLYQAEDLELLETLAQQVATALVNARACEEISALNARMESHLQELERQQAEIDRLRKRLKEENRYLREEIGLGEGFEGIVGESAPLREALSVARRAAETDSNVLITGESGTGKELAAQAVHNLSPRRERIFVRVNCGAIPAPLMESELFGHEKGAFTGARSMRRGRFELADGGSMLLDEIGDLPLPLQGKLLRVLQEQEFERVGGTRTLRVNVRVMASTNRDLAALVRQGRFRQDLYWRLNVVEVHMPALNQRREDVPALAAFFLEKVRRRTGRSVKGFDPEALRALTEYPWPGNVRELANVVERAVVVTRSDTIGVADLALVSWKEAEEAAAEEPLTLQEFLDRQRVRAVRAALARTRGNQARAAALLGLHRSNLSRMIKKLGDDALRWRSPETAPLPPGAGESQPYS